MMQIVYSDGTKIWLVNNRYHRLDGPAYISPSGAELWWLNGMGVDEEIYKKIQNSSKKKIY